MNKPNVRKWVKALRSGKYKQCCSKLHNGKAYCCLGVVCILAGIEPKEQNGIYEFANRAGVLPDRAKKWLGVTDPDPIIGDICASTWNDEKRAGFKRIADEIEKHWLSA